MKIRIANHIEIFLKQISNLKTLTILSFSNNMCNAQHWQELITSSLQYLYDFRFAFCYYYENQINEFIDK
ncbi:unnamed protein product [Rotaria sordida]|uniref:Uncharacterized protein n=1 Tax=Rotaria sordida TaxID=392033 RepID=A0A815TKE2_9BILA|nr:unnamed protein product [Rotaria sordida]CAF1507646.1 unnamed protein product [Rotaria sordida]